MSLVSLASPCSSSGKNANLVVGKASLSVSSLLVDCRFFNSILQSNQLEEALEIFSFISTVSLPFIGELISLEVFTKDLLPASSSLGPLPTIFFFSIIVVVVVKATHTPTHLCSASIRRKTIRWASSPSPLQRNYPTRRSVRGNDADRMSIARLLSDSVAQGLFTVGAERLEINNISMQSEDRSLTSSSNCSILFTARFRSSFCPSSRRPTTRFKVRGVRSDCFQMKPRRSTSALCSPRLPSITSPFCTEKEAFLMANEEKKKEQLPGLLPSKSLEEKRLQIVQCLIDEETLQPKKESKWQQSPG